MAWPLELHDHTAWARVRPVAEVIVRRTLIIGAASLLLCATTVQAFAHDANGYYPSKWQGDLTQDWFFTEGFPGGAKRDRVRDGVSQWNNLNQPMTFTEAAQRPDFDPMVCPDAGTNGIHWRDLPDANRQLAVTFRCTIGAQLTSTNMIVDSTRNWYDGVGDAPDGFLGRICSLPPDCQWDFWSVSSHEWGHMTGFFGPFRMGHFNPGENICNSNSSQHTMCPDTRIGTERLRTLEPHDRHTFETAY